MPRSSSVRFLLLVLLLSLIIAIAVIAILQSRVPDRLDVLVIWGWWADRAEETNHECHLWLVNPITQESSPPMVRSDGRCSYDVAMIDDVKRLIRWEDDPNGTRVVIYNLSNWEEISIDRVIHFGHPFPTFISQQDEEGYLYYSAPRLDEEAYHEQIYRVRLDDSVQPELFIKYDNGIAADPIMSPDGHFIAYWTLEGPKNRFPGECGLGCAGYYHIFNLATREDIELYPLVFEFTDRPDTVHCHLLWSPSSRFVTFNMGGCGHMRNEGLVIFDTLNNQIVKVIESTPNHRYPIIKQWISETDFLYIYSSESTELVDTPAWADKLQVYSISDDVSYELINLPFITGVDHTLYRIVDFELTKDLHSLAVQIESFTRSGDANYSLAIADLTQQSSTVNYFSYADRFSDQPGWMPFQNPRWSPSGKWIAYRSSFSNYRDDEINISSGTVYIVSKNTTHIFEVDTTRLRPHPRYAWLSLVE